VFMEEFAVFPGATQRFFFAFLRQNNDLLSAFSGTGASGGLASASLTGLSKVKDGACAVVVVGSVTGVEGPDESGEETEGSIDGEPFALP